MKCDFVVGQKVVCIDAKFLPGSYYGDENLPILGHIYTVREIQVAEHAPGQPVVVRLVEIVNPLKEYQFGTMECAFLAYRFRPLEKRKTDISIFLKLLTPAGRIPVDA